MTFPAIHYYSKPLKVLLLTALYSALIACGSDGGSSSTGRDSTTEVSYKVTIATTWTEQIFPTNFPAGAHFTALIGGTHSDQVIFWAPGQNASPGIESTAETGSKTIFSTEVSAAVADGKAEFVLATSANIGAAGSETLEFDINEDYPLVTLISMVAPTPDWFVGVHGLSLFDITSGEFKQIVVVDLKVYDAGTENGQGFSLNNADTQPKEPVALLSRFNPSDHDFIGGVGSGGEIIATMTFERIK